MSTTTIPQAADRNLANDVAVITKAIVNDVVSGANTLTPHFIETMDLLVPWISAQLGVKFYVNWIEASDEEASRAGVWYDYCEQVFNDCGK